MNTEQHQPEKDSQIIQRPPSPGSLIIPANGSMGKLAGDSSHWTVPAARHGQARPTGTARFKPTLFRGGLGKRSDRLTDS